MSSGPSTRSSDTGLPDEKFPDEKFSVAAEHPAEAAAVDVAKTFVSAVIWGEHVTLWELFTFDTRQVLLGIAIKRGMDEALAGRLRDGTAARGERDTFLTDLVNGLRADLRGNDLDALVYQLDTTADVERDGGPDITRVMLLAPMPAGLGAPLPVATIDLVKDGNQWRVDHLSPRTSK